MPDEDDKEVAAVFVVSARTLLISTLHICPLIRPESVAPNSRESKSPMNKGDRGRRGHCP